MPTTLAPFGFRPAYHPSGLDRASKYTIASAYGSPIYKGMPVILNTNGTITAGTAAADILGIFDGVEYVDSATGKPTVSNFWPAAQAVLAGTSPIAYIWDNPATVFEVQADGSVAQAAVGDQTDVTAGTVAATSGTTGLSTAAVNHTLAGASSQGQFRIVGFGQALDNVPGDAYTVVQVQIARHQYIANKVAI